MAPNKPSGIVRGFRKIEGLKVREVPNEHLSKTAQGLIGKYSDSVMRPLFSSEADLEEFYKASDDYNRGRTGGSFKIRTRDLKKLGKDGSSIERENCYMRREGDKIVVYAMSKADSILGKRRMRKEGLYYSAAFALAAPAIGELEVHGASDWWFAPAMAATGIATASVIGVLPNNRGMKENLNKLAGLVEKNDLINKEHAEKYGDFSPTHLTVGKDGQVFLLQETKKGILAKFLSKQPFKTTRGKIN